MTSFTLFGLIGVFLASATLCALLSLPRAWHRWLLREPSNRPPQQVHRDPTLRIGGLAVLAGLMAANSGILFFGQPASFETPLVLLATFLVACIPALIAGLIEDVTHKVSVGARLSATFASALILVLNSGAVLPGMGLPGIDLLFALPVLAVLITVFCMAGVANGFNLIDGFNGLASGTALVSLGAMGLIALGSNDPAVAWFCAFGIAAVLGFFVFNFPYGKIFLGDGGAYMLGLYVAFAAVLVLFRNAEVSPWACVLACFYPVTDTLFSILRRRHQSKHPGMPDRLHLHSLMYRRGLPLIFPGVGGLSLRARNSLTGFVMILFGLVPAAIGVMFASIEPVLQILTLLLMLCYWVLYARMVRMRWCLPFVSPRKELAQSNTRA